MKERPIIMSGPMVRAIIENRKFQTRRVMKKQPNIDPQTGDWLFTGSDGSQEVHPIEQWIDIQLKLHCLYGKVGDRLWVRETFAGHGDFDSESPKTLSGAGFYGGLWHRADYPKGYDGPWGGYRGKWRSPMFMPRAASRILLEITELRAEPLLSISESDAIAEGVKSREDFFSLWDSINGRGSSLENPWVRVISFKKIQPFTF